MLAALEEVGPWAERLQAFFATLYYAALRPSEAVALRENTCYLPDSGWGWLDLYGSEAKAGSAWTDTGTPRQARGLKHRPATEVRRVPIPPILATILRDHLKRYGAGRDGRMFTNMRGNPLQDSGYGRALHEARALAFSPDEVASPVARRAYDFRHGGITVWISNGLPITEAARRAGQGVEVLMRVYAGFLLIAYTTADNAISDAFDADTTTGRAADGAPAVHSQRRAS
ncbi:tyrosine-type recombinase/integrase [Cryptosporangium sp. NPDC051539]|uniref:tyrosine-type recombinase/integrase n=1 Tax=Cryptosporangium sp. NPDC051539 TaxID=3363962 RepID=UPI0037BCF9A5